MMINPFFYFIQSTIGMLLERASWNDDKSYEELANLTIDNVYADQMDAEGNIYDVLILDQSDADASIDLKFGNKTDLEPYFQSVMAMLKDNGYLAKYYKERKCLDLDKCLALVEKENLHSLIR